MKITRHQYTQKFYSRFDKTLVPKLDQIEISRYNQRLHRMEGKGQVSKYEHFLAGRLVEAGEKVVSQFAIPDMDEAIDENGIKYWNPFYWYYDLYLPSRDLIIEVDGHHHHTDNYTKKQDARKEYLARLWGIGLARIKNHDVYFKDAVESLLSRR